MPLTHEQIRAVVVDSFQVQERKIGHTLPQAVGRQVAEKLPFPVEPQQISKKISRMDFKPYVYEGAQEAVKGMLDFGDQVVVWTQGDPRTQLNKLASSGITEVRKELPTRERQRFSAYAREDKIAGLKDLVGTHLDQGVSKVFIVDDKAQNIARVDEALPESMKEKVVPVWINQGRSRDKVPEGYTVDSFTGRFETITDIRGIQEIRQKYTEKGENVSWFLDFDHTLANSEAARGAAFDRISQDLATKQLLASLPPVQIEGVRLNGNVRKASELTSGMSGGMVVRIETDDWSCVIKHNPDFPHKIRNEMDGYKKLAESPLSNRMLTPIYSSAEQAVQVLPHFEGVQMRQGIKDGLLSSEDGVRVLTELISLKAEWWGSQEKWINNPVVNSMQRSEWLDTQSRMHAVVQAVSEASNVPLEDVWLLPIVHEGVEYPSLISAMGKVSDTLKLPPPYTVLAHGDASGGNILMDPQTKDWKLIDAEWAGETDPAEAVVRMVKQVSTTTSSKDTRAGMHGKGNVLEISIEGGNEEAEFLQRFGLSSINHLGHILEDADFQDRVKTYLAGSYLRELALSVKRGNLNLAPLAILEAVKALS